MKLFWDNIIFSLVLIACKPNAVVERQSSKSGRDQFSDLYATGKTEIRNKGNFYFALFKKDYDLNFDLLPVKGSVEDSKIPYVGSWYPQVEGGTSRDNGSGNVLQKYDKVFNKGENKAQKWETDHHTVDKTNAAAGWAGHCNGFSAAAQRHAEPKKSVNRADTSFTPKDVKALLAEIHMSAKYYFLGGNRCRQDSKSLLGIPSARLDPTALGECDDVNPATFHVAIANWIGIQKHAIIVDTFSRDQVWNYPHFKYESSSQKITAAQAMTLISPEKPNQAYQFNPDAVSFRSVTTKVFYSPAYAAESLTTEVVDPLKRVHSTTYQYVLELDKAGLLIGGEWVGESQQTHPDFVWVALEPTAGDGNEFAANPNLDPKEVIKLWAESVGGDPNAPQLDILEPALGASWGRFSKFDVSINGIQTGSVFLGRPQVLTIVRREALHGDVSVEFILDGKSALIQTATGDGPVLATLPDLSVGIHTLEFTWVRGSAVIENQRVKIFAQ
ncbi:MAG: hypothetical protein NTV34_17540 [Proteobacteria bacterium]|nr:hypothetical protein [Pseudomonadota bacterium]